MSMSEQESSLATPVTTPLTQARLPKRLIALLLLYVAASVSGLIAKQGVLFCLLTLLMVLAIVGRQKAGLIMLRGYTLVQLALVSMLPVILYDPDNLVAGPTTVYLGQWQGKFPDYVILIVLIILSLLQVWIAFDKKVKAWFKPKLNLNIMN
ncbi:hypothetical protein DIKCMJMK_00424 [Shewanella oneidensis]|uniref:Membrane protein n=2 Tax=Shewanella oneidensis TaxID=70863 RepID=Q8EHC3_SHEON|nr:membrane protein [Shewanella oneidensis MR-1]MEE2026573.1 hypothetical protein [Shewanella oneidensis]